MKEQPKKGTLVDSPPVFGSWNNWYLAVIAGNIIFAIWMVLYFSKFN